MPIYVRVHKTIYVNLTYCGHFSAIRKASEGLVENFPLEIIEGKRVTFTSF